MGYPSSPVPSYFGDPQKKTYVQVLFARSCRKEAFSNFKMKLQIIFLATIALIVSSQMRCEASSIYGIDLADEEVFIVRRSGYLEAGDPCSASLDCYRGLCTRGTCEVSAPGHG